MAEVTIFAGPSSCGAPLDCLGAAGLTVRAPARRGDIAQLVQSAEPAVVVLCDGVFQAAPAVSHAEICSAVDAGWQVWGVSSIGAIRALEMRSVGVRGFGWVYAQFVRNDDFTDDEVCLLHLPDPTYEPVTEALVNLRYALQRRGAALGLDDKACSRVIARLRELWFGDRTDEHIVEALHREGAHREAVNGWLSWMKRHRVKSLDLIGLLRKSPWADRG